MAAPVAASPGPVVAPTGIVPPPPAPPPAPARLSYPPHSPYSGRPPAAAPVAPHPAVLLVHSTAPPATCTTAALDRLYMELQALD